MSIESKISHKKLLSDLESYASGEVPSQQTLVRAARLDHWSVEICRPGPGGKSFAVFVKGNV